MPGEVTIEIAHYNTHNPAGGIYFEHTFVLVEQGYAFLSWYLGADAPDDAHDKEWHALMDNAGIPH